MFPLNLFYSLFKITKSRFKLPQYISQIPIYLRENNISCIQPQTKIKGKKLGAPNFSLTFGFMSLTLGRVAWWVVHMMQCFLGNDEPTSEQGWIWPSSFNGDIRNNQTEMNTHSYFIQNLCWNSRFWALEEETFPLLGTSVLLK